MTYTRKELADTIDAYDREIARLQEAKRNLFRDYREQLAPMMDKAQVKAEVDAFKLAMKRLNALEKHGQMAVEAKDALVEQILRDLAGTQIATRVARGARGMDDELEADEIVEHVGALSEGKRQIDDDEVPTVHAAVKPDSEAAQVTDRVEPSAELDPETTETPTSTVSTVTVAVPVALQAANGELKVGEVNVTPVTQAVSEITTEDADGSYRAFKRNSGPIRPHCLKPTQCASRGGRVHCNSCEAAHRASGSKSLDDAAS